MNGKGLGERGRGQFEVVCCCLEGMSTNTKRLG